MRLGIELERRYCEVARERLAQIEVAKGRRNGNGTTSADDYGVAEFAALTGGVAIRAGQGDLASPWQALGAGCLPSFTPMLGRPTEMLAG
jgi:hypothetical protein